MQKESKYTFCAEYLFFPKSVPFMR